MGHGVCESTQNVITRRHGHVRVAVPARFVFFRSWRGWLPPVDANVVAEYLSRVVIVLFYRRAVKPIKAALGRSLRTIAAKPSFSSPVCVSPFVLVFDCVRWASSLIATARCKSVVQLVVQVKTVG